MKQILDKSNKVTLAKNEGKVHIPVFSSKKGKQEEKRRRERLGSR